MTKIIESQHTWRDVPETPEEHTQKLINLGWVISEETPEHYILQHDLIPGAARSVLRT